MEQADFAPQSKRSRQEQKSDVTTRAALAIIDSETAAREAKTARLRAARLAREEEEAARVKEKPAPKKPARSRAASKA